MNQKKKKKSLGVSFSFNRDEKAQSSYLVARLENKIKRQTTGTNDYALG